MLYYSYDGPVMSFDKCLTPRWRSHTYAPSYKKAKANLAYQYKKQFGLLPSAKISLPDKLKILQ